MSKYRIVGKHMSWLNYRRGGGGGAAVIIFGSHQRILQRAVQPLPREAIGPLFEGGRTSIFKGTYRHLWFSRWCVGGGGGADTLPSTLNQSMHYG